MKLIVRHALVALLLFAGTFPVCAQINADRVLLMGRNALFYEDYVLAIQRFNMVISSKPWLGEPYFYRGLAKFYLEDYQGAEIDCSSALERNPYVCNHFVLRALCRVNQGRFALAEQDYSDALKINPLEKNCWHNIVLCQMELQEYERADSSLDEMIKHWPKEAQNYSLKAQVALGKKDSVAAEGWVDRALEHNQYEGSAWSLKAMFQAQREEYQQAEESLDKAIVQMPRVSGLYVNRALARYNQDNLRGAMKDYDTALEIEPTGFVAHYNRGLLRANVGEDNLAIEDFDYVLKIEPNNTIALYNRALLLDNVGDYKGAIRDISTVIQEYPEFWEGYRRRASIRRKIGDVYGAERDEFKILKAQMAVASGTYKSSGKTRKKSELDIENYDKLVEEDVQETENEYTSEYRGKVQNRHAELTVEPLYVLTYYRKTSDIKLYAAYSREVDKINQSHTLPKELYLSANEQAMTEENVNRHFEWITAVSEELNADAKDKAKLFQRALDYYHVRDFDNAIADLNASLLSDDSDVLALILRAQCRHAQLEVSKNSTSISDYRLGCLMVLQDYNKAIELNPNEAFLHYNKGNLLVGLGDYKDAVAAYSEALKLDDQFPDAYYNRGVAYLLNQQLEEGLNDLSQAGEQGLYSAYNLIKKFSKEKK